MNRIRRLSPVPDGPVRVARLTSSASRRPLSPGPFPRRGERGDLLHARLARFASRSALIGAALALSGAASAAWAAPPEPAATPPQPVPARYESCAGWGLCTFRLLPTAAAAQPVLPVPPARPAPPAAPVQAAGERVRVRLRGVGDPALSGTCAPEREAARTIRRFVEGILARATRIELVRIEPRSDGSVLATVRADGTDVVEILVHIGLGRERPLPPDAAWCD